MTTTAVAPLATPAAPATPAAATASASASRYGFGDDGFTFGDFLDIINPLQHIPVVGTIYRAITGDTMEAGSEIAGGALYGGPIGALLSVADVAFTAETGKPIDETMLAWVGIGGDDAPAAVAHNPPAPSVTAPAMATSAPVARTALATRAFPAATTRIVPLANYAQPPVAAAPATAPEQPEPRAATHAPTPLAPAASAQAETAPPAPPPAPPAAASPATPAAAAMPTLEGADALLQALRDSGVDPASAARAAAAYRATSAMQTPLVRPVGDTQSAR